MPSPSWSDGVDHSVGYTITAVDWNIYLGEFGDLMVLKAHAHDGATGGGATALGPLSGLIIGTNAASAGGIRLANNLEVNWRKADNSADILGIYVNSSN